MVYKLTFDSGILREPALLPSVMILKAWEAEGKLELFEADHAKEVATTYGWPGATKPAAPPSNHRQRHSQKKNDSAGASFQRIAAVLFPSRDSNRLSMTEINNVAHLLRHFNLGHAYFITVNTKNFIEEGRRERLKSIFKIDVRTPDEMVELFRETNAWAPDAGKEAPKKRARGESV